MVDLGSFHHGLQLAHVAVGFAGLALFWVPLLATKGSRLHVWGGRAFSGCALFVGVSGLAFALWGLVHPSSYPAGFSETMSALEWRMEAERLRFILSIAGFLALGLLSGVALGLGVARTRSAPRRLRTVWLVALEWGLGTWSAALALYGIVTIAAACAGLHDLSASGSIPYALHVVLGAVGVYGVAGDLQYLRESDARTPGWKVMHVNCMIGAGAGFYAAFFLFGASRWLDIGGLGPLAATLVPLTLGSWLSSHWQRRVEREEDAGRGAA